jgi:hypothetical protein
MGILSKIAPIALVCVVISGRGLHTQATQNIHFFFEAYTKAGNFCLLTTRWEEFSGRWEEVIHELYVAQI